MYSSQISVFTTFTTNLSLCSSLSSFCGIDDEAEIYWRCLRFNVNVASQSLWAGHKRLFLLLGYTALHTHSRHDHFAKAQSVKYWKYCLFAVLNLVLCSRTGSCFSRENVQRLQQDLAHMILTCLERRSRGSVRRKKPLSSQSKEDDKDQESEVESESGHPEYLHMATVDNTLSTFL